MVDGSFKNVKQNRVKKTMNNDTVQGYRVAVAKKYGVNVAIIYDKVMFWGTKGERKDGWVYKTYAEMENETALSAKMVGLAYEKLVALGVIETKVMKVGDTPKKHFRLVNKKLPTLPKGKVQNAKSLENSQTQSPITTETTTETTQDSLVPDNSLVGALEEESAAAPTAARRALLEQLIGIVNPREKPTADRIRLLNARLKDYTSEEIIESANAFSESEWHKENKQMSIDNLLVPSKFGRWYAVRKPIKAKPIIPTSEDYAAKRAERLRKNAEIAQSLRDSIEEDKRNGIQ